MGPRKRDQKADTIQNARGKPEELPWAIIYYLTPEATAPALEFLDACPSTIDAQFTATLDAVAAAPPLSFSGGASGRPCMAQWVAGMKSV